MRSSCWTSWPISKEKAGPQGESCLAGLNTIKFKWKTIMAKIEKVLDRIDEIRANSVSDIEFEQTWGKSLDKHVEELMRKWDELQAQAKAAIEENVNNKKIKRKENGRKH